MFGIDDAINAGLGLFKTTLDKFGPADANVKAQIQSAHDAEIFQASQQAAQLEATKYQADIELLKKQVDVNMAQAANSNLFVSGARPFAMWMFPISMIGMAGYLLFLVQLGKEIGAFFEVFFAIMGFTAALFGVHTVERHRGVAPEQPDGPNVPAATSIVKDVGEDKIPRA
jgi:hypothetical protein